MMLKEKTVLRFSFCISACIVYSKLRWPRTAITAKKIKIKSNSKLKRKLFKNKNKKSANKKKCSKEKCRQTKKETIQNKKKKKLYANKKGK